ncbi:MAG: beta-ketoacyl-[acyl-carrier-protein] synthase family protein [Bacteroidetes bacterium]|nr:MAG: beta-ketoacyl-[acyl-carrier-protein] synthase family protein [Bacteroidota bacterium]
MKDEERVVITGMGVVAPNGIGLQAFTEALREGRSGAAYQEELEDLVQGCAVGAFPKFEQEEDRAFLSRFRIRKLQSSGILYGCMAGVEAWEDAGLEILPKDAAEPDWDSGCVMGGGITGIESISFGIKMADQGTPTKIGGRNIQQSMSSGPSAYLGGLLGLGNQVTTNSSACATGTEAILMCYERIHAGRAKRMIAGGCDSNTKYVWTSFDNMRVLNRTQNEDPQKASRPMSATAAGFMPGAGAGALVLESLASAKARHARIYAEVLGGASNSGGQRGKGSITAPSTQGIVRCIKAMMSSAGIQPLEIDAISGHLTGTHIGDPIEIKSWVEALGRSGADFPYINAPKSMIGHCLSAAGAIESVAAILQIYHRFLHPNLNAEDLHPEIAKLVDRERIPLTTLENVDLHTLAKASFGFGDVNSCVAFRKYIS